MLFAITVAAGLVLVIVCLNVAILALLISGEFDIVHYSGHGSYDGTNPSASGWIFGQDCVLSAKEIFRARKVPRLVFANACFSAVTTTSSSTDVRGDDSCASAAAPPRPNTLLIAYDSSVRCFDFNICNPHSGRAI